MIIRRENERGAFENSWLKAKHSFSFSSYFDPQWMGFGNLRVLNHDQVQPNGGFSTHGHKDMEIITYVLKGAVAHKDSMGNEEKVSAGEIQRMSAGTGVQHSEFNPSNKELLELFQIWVLPEQNGMDPSYEQKRYGREEKLNQLLLVVDEKGRQGALKVFAPFQMYASVLEKEKSLTHTLSRDGAWLQVATGRIEINGQELGPGDGAAFNSEDKELQIKALEESEFVLLEVSQTESQ